MNQTLNIIKNLDSDKYDISIITLFNEAPNNSMLDAYKAVCNQCICLNMSMVSAVMNGAKKVTKALNQIKPDIIHGLGMPPYRMTLNYKNAKHLVTLRNYIYEDYPSHYNKFIGSILAILDMNLIRKLVKRGEIFVTCSKSLTKIYKERENLDFPYIQNGIDISKFPMKIASDKVSLRRKLNLPENKIIYIYTGGIIDRKDQESAIKGILMSKYKDDSYLVLCGIGKNYDTLKERYLSEHNIIFTGKIDNVSEYLRAADIYISTSKSEGLPNGVLEAMASGTCVLLSDIPQHLEILDIKNSAGLKYKLGNSKDLIAKIEEIATMDFVSMGKISNTVVEKNFTAEIMSRKYSELYNELINY